MSGRDEQSVQIDLSRGSLVSQGDHIAVIEDLTLSDEVGPSGYKYIRVNLEIAGKKDPDAGQAVSTVLSLSPKARFKLDEFLDAIRAPQSGKMAFSQLLKFIGKPILIQVVHEMDKNDRLQAVIKKMQPIPATKTTEVAEQPTIAADGSPVDSPSPAEAVGIKLDEEDLPF